MSKLESKSKSFKHKVQVKCVAVIQTLRYVSLNHIKKSFTCNDTNKSIKNIFYNISFRIYVCMYIGVLCKIKEALLVSVNFYHK